MIHPGTILRFGETAMPYNLGRSRKQSDMSFDILKFYATKS